MNFRQGHVPDLRRAAILVNVSYPVAVPEMGDVRAAAGTLGLDVVTLEIRQGSDIAPAINTFQGRSQALYVVGDPLVSINRTLIAILAASTLAVVPGVTMTATRWRTRSAACVYRKRYPF